MASAVLLCKCILQQIALWFNVIHLDGMCFEQEPDIFLGQRLVFRKRYYNVIIVLYQFY